MARARARVKIVPYETKYLSEVLALARAMHAESTLHRDIPLDEDKLTSQFEDARSSWNLYCRLALRDGRVIGGFFGAINPPYFSTTMVAKDLAVFVQPSSRGSCAAVALIADFEEWAASEGVHHVILSQTTGVKMDMTKSLYERLGYEPVGTHTVKRI